MKVVLLFTECFPYGNHAEHAFLKNEIKYLAEKFDKIITFPSNTLGALTVYDSLEINTELATLLKNKHRIKYLITAFKSKYLIKELFSKGILFWNVKRLKKIIYYIAQVQIIKDWCMRYCIDYDILVSNKPIFYTYWNTSTTMALASLFKQRKNIKVISRIHGYDLYEERNEGYIPCFDSIVKMVDKIYLPSKAGYKYLSSKYPAFQDKFALSYLGVSEAVKKSKPSDDNIVRIVSCANLIAIKRVDLIIKGITKFVEKYDRKLFWTHFGDGILFKEINKLAENFKSKSFDFNLKGFVKNKNLLGYYEKYPVDIFVTASKTEGGVPVSLQEAQAHGIPVVGTKVGGIPEIVNDKVGVLLSNNPSEEEIADSIHHIISDENRFMQYRKSSFENWKEKFNEKINYDNFASELINLLDN